MNDALRAVSTRTTVQTEQADARQVENSAGGYTFTLNDKNRLERFLILGTDGGTYYAREREFTMESAHFVIALARTDPGMIVRTVLEVDEANRAPKHEPMLFALAVVAGTATDADDRRAALDAMLRVARTGTHLFMFLGFVQNFRGWGRTLGRAVGQWYGTKPPSDLAYQVLKYRQRHGWTHRDALRQAHPSNFGDEERAALYQYIVSGEIGEHVPEIVRQFDAVQNGADPVPLIEDGSPLSWEMLPDAALSRVDVWRALIDNHRVPYRALMRQVSRLTRIGALEDPTLRETVLANLRNPTRTRIHPVNILVAARTYASGRGKGTTWTPAAGVVDALDQAFYSAFREVDVNPARTLLALDVSGSMVMPISGMPLTAREASGAMALVTMAHTPRCRVVGFTGNSMGYGKASPQNQWYPSGGTRNGISELDISPRRRLDDVLRSIDRLPFGGTDCSLPFLYALDKGLEVDTFVVYTDNETWSGAMHPHQALARYRERTGINAKSVVVGMTATNFTIADPDDPGMLDVVGFDSAAPSLIADFSRPA